MLATMDRAGRLVIPKPMREAARLTPGPVEIVADDAGLRLSVPAAGALKREGRFLTFATGTEPLTVDEIRELRLANQR